MISEVKELTISELNKITWDYSEPEIVGLFNNKAVRRFLFEVKECNDINPLSVLKCNVVEGWIEHMECEGEPVRSREGKIILLGTPKIDGNGDIKRTRLNCNVVVDILECTGEIIVTLGKK